MKPTLVYSTRIKLWLGCDSRLENSASLFAPVAMEVGCLAFAAAVPYRDVQLFPAPAALHHARVSCVGFVRGCCVSPRAKSTANEGDDHGHHEEGYFIGFAFVRHGKGEAIVQAMVGGGKQSYAHIACIVSHVRCAKADAEDLDMAVVSGFEYRAEVDLEGCKRGDL